MSTGLLLLLSSYFICSHNISMKIFWREVWVLSCWHIQRMLQDYIYHSRLENIKCNMILKWFESPAIFHKTFLENKQLNLICHPHWLNYYAKTIWRNGTIWWIFQVKYTKYNLGNIENTYFVIWFLQWPLQIVILF